MIVDTWPRFASVIAGQLGSAEAFLDAWHDRYLSRWPALRRKCLEDYAAQGESWRELGAKWIYPVVRDQMPRMARARANLLVVIPEVDARYRAIVGHAPRMQYVISVDMGFAGWSTHYQLPGQASGMTLQGVARMDVESVQKKGEEFLRLVHRGKCGSPAGSKTARRVRGVTFRVAPDGPA